MHHLDRILDRHDVARARHVDPAEHRSRRRRLPRAGHAGYEDETAAFFGERRDGLRETKRFEGRDTGEHPPDRDADEAALTEDVHPEAADAVEGVREVDLVRLPEHAALLFCHEGESEPLAVLRRERRHVHRDQVPVHAEVRRTAGADMDVRRHVLGAGSEQGFDVHMSVGIRPLEHRTPRGSPLPLGAAVGPEPVK